MKTLSSSDTFATGEQVAFSSSAFSSTAAFAEAAASAMEVPDSFLEVFGNVTWSIFGPSALAFEKVMMFLCPSLINFFNDSVAKHGYEFRKPLPLTARPVDALFCIFMYFAALGVLYLFSKAVGKRAYKSIGLVHNAFLFSISLYMGLGFLVTAWASFDRPWNNPILDPKTNDNGWRMTKMMWVFAISKLPEYGDTFLMVLKQNYHQISFLHLYHHCSIFLWCYIATIFGSGGDVYWSGMVNSWVHVAMYGYYAGTMAFKDGPIRRALNSIKFIITKGQITQFVLNMVQVFYVTLIADKYHYPVYMMVGQVAYMSTMVALFANFLLRNQGKPDRRREKSGAAVAANKNAAVVPKDAAVVSEENQPVKTLSPASCAAVSPSSSANHGLSPETKLSRTLSSASSSCFSLSPSLRAEVDSIRLAANADSPAVENNLDIATAAALLPEHSEEDGLRKRNKRERED